MSRRPCQYCTRPLEWWAPLLRFLTCNECASRMSMGGSPLRPPPPPQPPDGTGEGAAGSATPG